jgi:hypothetical protein
MLDLEALFVFGFVSVSLLLLRKLGKRPGGS